MREQTILVGRMFTQVFATGKSPLLRFTELLVPGIIHSLSVSYYIVSSTRADIFIVCTVI